MTFVSELLIRSLRLTKNYKIVGYNLNINRNTPQKSSALKISNILIGIYHIIKLRIKWNNEDVVSSKLICKFAK